MTQMNALSRQEPINGSQRPEQQRNRGPRPPREGVSFWRVLRSGFWPSLVVVLVGGLAYALLLPPPVEEPEIPLPVVDRGLERRRLELERRRAQAARRDALPFEVRAAGEAFRRFGLDSVRADAKVAENRLVALRRKIGTALRQYGSEPVLRLRALQGELFLKALEHFRTGSSPGLELLELGGNFAQKARDSGWLDRDGSLLFNPNERLTLFRIRWTELAGLRKNPAFSPTLNELRIYYRALLTLPEGALPRERSQNQLRYVEAFARLEPDYPGGLARGAVLLRLGDKPGAQRELTAHLARFPDGPWALRARSYLRTAL